MYGVTIAFKEYNLFKGINGSEWTGFKNFIEVFKNSLFYKVVRNTFMLNFLDLIIGFPAPIILALLLNELRSPSFKKTVQAILYLPHFLSWIIISGIVFQVFSPTYGIINNVLASMGFEKIPFLTSASHWIFTYVIVGVWQNIGWGTILYLAAISSVPVELYEAAELDGVNRLQKMWNITLPCIKSTIIILLILSIGRMAIISFERPFVLGNSYVRDVSEVISTYVYRVGIKSTRFSIAAAVGLFQSVVSLIFLLSANTFAKKLGHEGIF
jgi:putative aldouronate transport system permease protein